MLFYFIIFCIVGFIIGFALKDFKISIAVIVIVTACWAFVFGPWALATFIELMIGYTVGKIAAKEIKK